MFTGIVQEVGTVRRIEQHATGVRLEFQAAAVLEDAGDGDSIAVDGCCLTMVERGSDWWAVDAVEETVRRSSLGQVRIGDRVNLERPLRIGGRLDGHLVQGHVDGIGGIVAYDANPDGSLLMSVKAPSGLLRYMVEKGSVAVDGVSLTIVAIDDDGFSFSVALIPHTQAVTTLGHKPVGAPVNLEVDMVAKYIERLLIPRVLEISA
jgi:riboflavin synthase